MIIIRRCYKNLIPSSTNSWISIQRLVSCLTHVVLALILLFRFRAMLPLEVRGRHVLIPHGSARQIHLLILLHSIMVNSRNGLPNKQVDHFTDIYLIFKTVLMMSIIILSGIFKRAEPPVRIKLVLGSLAPTIIPRLLII